MTVTQEGDQGQRKSERPPEKSNGLRELTCALPGLHFKMVLPTGFQNVSARPHHSDPRVGVLTLSFWLRHLQT